ncbi:uncharacterized protein LOC109613897 [Musca domestica]|uniref:Uncharacterized protein LOC109613897 n=1 Tax=Musca domestica TaxID=7370 RepID=A0A9J7DM07_MUSDO|nr:uncharacterized protein LOC109613897 [Musca domestica]
MIRQLFLFLYFVLLSQWVGLVHGTTKIAFLGSRVRYNSKYFSNLTLFTENSTINADLMLLKSLRQGFKANIEVQLRLNNSKTHQKLFSYVLNICELIVSLRSSIFKKWFESLLKYSNFMQNCPVAEGHYYVHGWRPDASLIPSYLFAGDYRIKGYCFYGNYKKKNMEFLFAIDVDATTSIAFFGSRVRFNPKYFSNFTLSIENSTINADMMLIKPLRQGFKTNAEVQLRLNNSRKHQKLFSYALNVCELVVSLRNSIFKRWFESLLKNGNFMQNCPVSVGHYYVHDWRPDASLIPSYLFAGDYRIKGYCFFGNYKKKNMEFVIDIEVDAIIS